MSTSFNTTAIEYTELEILQDQVAKFRQWYQDVMNLTSSKEPGTKLMISYRDAIIKPTETSLMTDISQLKREISEWNTTIYELAMKFKTPGNLVFSNKDGIIHRMGYPSEYLDRFVLTPEKPIGFSTKTLYPPAAAFYVSVSDRVRFKKGSKGKVGSIASIKEDSGASVAVQWDGVDELDRGVWCGKKNTFSLVYAIEK